MRVFLRTLAQLSAFVAVILAMILMTKNSPGYIFIPTYYSILLILLSATVVVVYKIKGIFKKLLFAVGVALVLAYTTFKLHYRTPSTDEQFITVFIFSWYLVGIVLVYFASEIKNTKFEQGSWLFRIVGLIILSLPFIIGIYNSIFLNRLIASSFEIDIWELVLTWWYLLCSVIILFGLLTFEEIFGVSTKTQKIQN